MRPTARPASREDLDAIGSIYGAAAGEQEALKPGWGIQAGWGKSARDVIARVVSTGTLDGFPAAVFVSEIEGEIAGYSIVSLEAFPGGDFDGRPARLRMHHLAVEEEARGVGIGELLLAVAARWGRAQGISICEMEVVPGNRGAKNFCEAHGLKARAITMSGSVAEVLGSIELDEAEDSGAEAAVAAALCQRDEVPKARREIAAGCIVVSGGRILLARRTAPPFAGRWSIPGGHPQAGESLSECARRELLEETGVRARIVGVAGLAERSWKVESGTSVEYLIVNFIGVPERGGACLGIEGGAEGAELAWVVPDSVPGRAVPGVVGFLERARPAIDAVSAGEPLPAAVYSTAEER